MARGQVLTPWQRMLRAGDPTLVIDRPIGEYLEILTFAHRPSLGVVKGRSDGDAIHRFLIDTIDAFRGWDVSDLQDRGRDVDEVRELVAHSTRVLDPGGPRDHHRVPRAAQMRGHLLHPLEGGIASPRPA